MSSKHHHHRHHKSQASETKSMSNSRKVLSFILFVLIFTLSVTTCLKVVVLNPKEFAGCLTDKNYSNSLFLDAQQYAYDLCDKCSIPRDCVDDEITYNSIYAINQMYVVGNLCKDERFTKSTYSTELDALAGRLEKSVEAKLKAENIDINDAQIKSGVKNFSQQVVDYVAEITEIEFIEQLQTLTNIGKVALIALIVVSALFSLITILAIISIGKKKYRSIRAISYSFIATGFLNFILVLGVGIIEKTKSLYIFPTYLCDAAMNYVSNCVGAFFGAGVASIAVALILTTVGWKLKRDDK